MSYTYSRVVTDEEEAAIKYYVPEGVKKELDFLIDTGIAHTLTSYKALIAKESEAVVEAKLSEYETIKPVYDKYDSLAAEEKKIADDLFNGKITAKDITVTAATEPKEG